MDTGQVIARFEVELQALAMMDHENIAKVFDAGTTDEGRPFFVMELVSGTPITKFCDDHKLGIPERLELFNQVCNAVQHAHQKGIIHRDLKPGNVLVALHDDRPVAKVIDFGLAKATSQKLTQKTLFTEHGQILGTMEYMSPEQANLNDLDVDTRSDIYSLGVILYELLTGSTPLKRESLREAGFMEILDRIKEEDPERPSSRISESVDSLASISAVRQVEPRKFSAIMKGELDWIILKAMEKDRTRRYETANGFAADIRRYLSDEPILARPPSAGYKLSKLIRKNRFAVGFAGTVALLLVIGIGVSTYLTFWAMDETAIARAAEQKTAETLLEVEAERDAKEQARKEAEDISTFLSEVFQSPDPARDGLTITVAEMLDTATKKLETDLTDQPYQRAKLQETLGLTYQALGLHQQAISLREQVRDYQLATVGLEHPDTLGALNNLATSYFGAGRQDDALEMREEAMKLFRKVSGPEHPDTLMALANLATSYASAGRQDEALEMREEVLKLRRTVSGLEHPDTLEALANLAVSYASVGRLDEALEMQEETLKLRREVSGSEHSETLKAINNLALSYASSGRLEDATSLWAESSASNSEDTILAVQVAVLQTWFNKEADYLATSKRMLEWEKEAKLSLDFSSIALIACLRTPDESKVRVSALDLARKGVDTGKDSPYLFYFQMVLGMAEHRNGNYTQADETLAGAVTLAASFENKKLRSRIETTANFYRTMSLFQQGKPDEARTLFTATEAKMKPLPADEKNPFVNDENHNDLIMWLAYKEAKALLAEFGTPGTTSDPDEESSPSEKAPTE